MDERYADRRWARLVEIMQRPATAAPQYLCEQCRTPITSSPALVLEEVGDAGLFALLLHRGGCQTAFHARQARQELDGAQGREA